MSIDIHPLSPALGAQISGVDLSLDLTGEQRNVIERALLDHQVLFFRDQPITPQQQARFAAHFGDLHIHPIYPNVPEQPEVLILDTAVTDVRAGAGLRWRHVVGERHRGVRSAVPADADVARRLDRDP
jgi:taurine dioxygenase